MNDLKQINQEIALNREIETAVQLIQVGLRELQAIGTTNAFYHLPLLTLANGIERLLKMTLCLRFHETKERFPNLKDVLRGESGHNLTALLKHVVEDCFSEKYINSSPIGAEDFSFLKKDQQLNNVIKILCEFGRSSRYYTLDIAFCKTPETDSPESQWECLETELLQKRPDLLAKLGDFDTLDEIYSYISQEFTKLLERFCRALARLFTIGQLRVLAIRSMGNLDAFLLIKDSDLGLHDYTVPRR